MMVGRLLSYWDGIFSGAMLNFQVVNLGEFTLLHSWLSHLWYEYMALWCQADADAVAAAAAQPSPYAEKVSEKKQDWTWSLQRGQNYNFCKKVIQKMLSDVDVVLQMQLFDSSHWWSIWLLRVIFLRSNGWAKNFHPEAVDFFAAVGQRNNGQGDFEKSVIWRKFICRSFRVAMLKVVKMKQYFDEHCQDLVKPPC